jgi:hypothetical protein
MSIKKYQEIQQHTIGMIEGRLGGKSKDLETNIESGSTTAYFYQEFQDVDVSNDSWVVSASCGWIDNQTSDTSYIAYSADTIEVIGTSKLSQGSYDTQISFLIEYDDIEYSFDKFKQFLSEDIIISGKEAELFLKDLENPLPEDIETRRKTMKQARKIYKKHSRMS